MYGMVTVINNIVLYTGKKKSNKAGKHAAAWVNPGIRYAK